jgi:hypothetical protein
MKKKLLLMMAVLFSVFAVSAVNSVVASSDAPTFDSLYPEYQKKFELEVEEEFKKYSKEVDGELAKKSVPTSDFVNKLITRTNKFKTKISDISFDLKSEIENTSYSGSVIRPDGLYLDEFNEWNSFTKKYNEELMRKINFSLFLAIEADAEIERVRSTIPLIDSINGELNHMLNRLDTTRNNLGQFNNHFPCTAHCT